MRKPVAILVTTLILVTALVVGALARAFYADSSRPVAATAPQPPAAALFYDALNAALATGNTQGLRGLLAPDFVDHDTPGPFSPDDIGLMARVLALRATFPGLTLAPEAVSSAGELSVWRVTVTGATDGALLDLPVRAATAWNALDIFQSRDGKILAHWGSGNRGLLGPAPQRIEFALPKADRWAPAMERWDFPSGSAEATAAGETPKVLTVRAGTVRVGNAGGGPKAAVPLATISGRGELSPLQPGDSRDLVANDVVLLSPGAAVALQNLSDAPAALLLYELTEPVIGGAAMGAAASTPAPGVPAVTKTTVAAGPAQLLPAGACRLEFGRVTLPVGGSVPLHTTSGISLLALEAGALTMTAGDDALTVLSGATGTYTRRTSADLTAGDAAMVAAGVAESFFNTGADSAALVVVNLVVSS
jgi:quercetin dioxygenase-like cupin family protein